MDAALPIEAQNAIQRVLEPFRQTGVHYHSLRTRQSGARQFVFLHVIVPGIWTVQRGHQLLERIETELRGVLANVTVFTHIESIDDPASWNLVNVLLISKISLETRPLEICNVDSVWQHIRFLKT